MCLGVCGTDGARNYGFGDPVHTRNPHEICWLSLMLYFSRNLAFESPRLLSTSLLRFPVSCIVVLVLRRRHDIQIIFLPSDSCLGSSPFGRLMGSVNFDIGIQQKTDLWSCFFCTHLLHTERKLDCTTDPKFMDLTFR